MVSIFAVRPASHQPATEMSDSEDRAAAETKGRGLSGVSSATSEASRSGSDRSALVEPRASSGDEDAVDHPLS